MHPIRIQEGWHPLSTTSNSALVPVLIQLTIFFICPIKLAIAVNYPIQLYLAYNHTIRLSVAFPLSESKSPMSTALLQFILSHSPTQLLSNLPFLLSPMPSTSPVPNHSTSLQHLAPLHQESSF